MIISKQQPAVIPAESKVAIQYEDGVPWTHDTVVNLSSANHNDQSHKVHLTRAGCIIKKEYEMHQKNTNNIT